MLILNFKIVLECRTGIFACYWHSFATRADTHRSHGASRQYDTILQYCNTGIEKRAGCYCHPASVPGPRTGANATLVVGEREKETGADLDDSRDNRATL